MIRSLLAKKRFVTVVLCLATFLIGLFIGATKIDLSEVFIIKKNCTFKWEYVGHDDESKRWIRSPLEYIDKKTRNVDFWVKVIKDNDTMGYSLGLIQVNCKNWTDKVVYAKYYKNKKSEGEDFKLDNLDRYIMPDSPHEMRTIVVCKKAGLAE